MTMVSILVDRIHESSLLGTMNLIGGRACLEWNSCSADIRVAIVWWSAGDGTECISAAALMHHMFVLESI